MVVVVQPDGYTNEDVLSTNHVLAQRHHQLEGTSYGILARAFTEEGGLLMELLSDETKKDLHYVIKKEPTATLTPDEVRLELNCLYITAILMYSTNHLKGRENTLNVAVTVNLGVEVAHTSI